VDNTSLENQWKAIEAYCTLKNFDLMNIYADEAVSGGKPIGMRPEGSKLMELLQSEQVQAIVILKLDRAFRDVVDCLQSIDSWEQQGVSLHIIDLGGNSVDSSSPAGRFMLTVLAAAAEMERGMIRDRCNTGRRIKQAQGFKVGKDVPYGYDLASPSDPENKLMLENSREQEIIRDILTLKAEGRSLRAIATELNHRGITTKQGANWKASQVSRILKRAA